MVCGFSLSDDFCFALSFWLLSNFGRTYLGMFRPKSSSLVPYNGYSYSNLFLFSFLLFSYFHLFMECGLALRVWDMCYRWIGIFSVQHNVLKSHFESFLLAQASNKQNMVWKGIWATIVRCIWEHRNSVVFKQRVVDAKEVFQKAQLKSWLWMKHKVERFNYSFMDWILNPMSCIKSYK